MKFHGGWAEGCIMITDRSLVVVQSFGAFFAPIPIPLAHTSELNELQFKFSMLSMTSVGPGY